MDRELRDLTVGVFAPSRGQYFRLQPSGDKYSSECVEEELIQVSEGLDKPPRANNRSACYPEEVKAHTCARSSNDLVHDVFTARGVFVSQVELSLDPTDRNCYYEVIFD